MGEQARQREGQLRAAMERLLRGEPVHTDGQLDVKTWAAEALVARQLIYRAHRGLLEEFHAHVRQVEAGGDSPDRRGRRIEVLEQRLADAEGKAARYRTERDEARRERDVYASQVTFLDEQNRLLREHAESAEVTGLNTVRQRSR